MRADSGAAAAVDSNAAQAIRIQPDPNTAGAEK
jgi:hypothetical protein